jgi:hypothetical protein
MTRVSRLGLVAAFALALAAPAARAADPDPLLPADSDTVAYVNFKQVLGSEVVKKFALEQIKQALAGQDAKKLLDELGLDPLKDIDTLWAGSSGKGPDDMKALVVVLGKFDPKKLLATAEAATKKDGDKFSIVKDESGTLFKYQPDKGNPVYGTVVNATTVVAGTDKKVIAAALKQAEDKQKKAPLGATLAGLVKKMDAKSSLFAVSVVKGKLDNDKLPQQLPPDIFAGFEKALPKTDTLSMVVKVTADINLEVTFGMKDEDAAADMGDAMKSMLGGIKGLLALLATDPKAKPLNDVVKTLTSSVKDKSVVVTGKVTGETLGKLANPAD